VPACHPYGYEARDLLAMNMKVKRTFHDHHHYDRTKTYRLTIANMAFDAVALPFCASKNGLAEVVFDGPGE
jgi:hypothetical protein